MSNGKRKATPPSRAAQFFRESRGELRELVMRDDVLRLRSHIFYLGSLDDVEEHIYHLLTCAVRERAWYCTRYLISLVPLDHYTDQQHANLLWHGVKSRESQMFDMVYTNTDCLSCSTPSKVTIPELIIKDNQADMLQLLVQKWDGLPQLVDDNQGFYDSKLPVHATMQILASVPGTNREEICERLLAHKRTVLGDTSLVDFAVSINDYLLLDHLAAHHPLVLAEAMYQQKSHAAPFLNLTMIAKTNRAKTITAVKEFIDLNRRDSDNETLLHQAARSGSISTVEALIDAGADTVQYKRKGPSPLTHLLNVMKQDVIEEDVWPSMRCAALIAGSMHEKFVNLFNKIWRIDDQEDTLTQVLYNPGKMEREFGGSRVHKH